MLIAEVVYHWSKLEVLSMAYVGGLKFHAAHRCPRCRCRWSTASSPRPATTRFCLPTRGRIVRAALRDVGRARIEDGLAVGAQSRLDQAATHVVAALVELLLTLLVRSRRHEP